MTKKVLIVDDESGIRRLLRRKFESMGYTVAEAEDGAGIVGVFKRERPDVVLMDLHLPKIDGIEALTEILEVDPAVPVIMITGDGDEKKARLAMERGARDFISKPLDLDNLELSVMANLLISKKDDPPKT